MFYRGSKGTTRKGRASSICKCSVTALPLSFQRTYQPSFHDLGQPHDHYAGVARFLRLSHYLRQRKILVNPPSAVYNDPSFRAQDGNSDSNFGGPHAPSRNSAFAGPLARPLHYPSSGSDFAQTRTGSQKTQHISIFVGKWKLDGDVKPGGMGPGGKTTGTVSCEWIAEGFGILCHETVSLPGTKGKLTDVVLMAYDDEAKNYFFSQVSVGVAVWVGRGTVNGDTWIWTVDGTADGKPIHMRFTDKWTSPDSYEFKNEIGESLCSQANGLIGFS